MTQETKDFIENHIDLIANDNFDELYHLVKVEDIDCSDLTAALYTAELYPLDHMTYVPNRFAAKINTVQEYVIPEGIQKIEQFAFDGNALKRVTFPETLEELKRGCFSFCKNLTLIDTKHVEYISEDVFIGCTSLNTLITSANVIDKFAFKDCMNLKNIHISKNLNTIGYGAFNHVPATEIYYGGTKQDWSYVVLSHYWKEDTLHKIICTDGEVLI